ncbi:fimbrial protein [Collimonas sp. NPDC087041]|uniref:fimbrial protein n=1 Tax=Collimonas sp. NPDC087041 TaxID=3363960 RepID=UPI003804BFFB
MMSKIKSLMLLACLGIFSQSAQALSCITPPGEFHGLVSAPATIAIDPAWPVGYVVASINVPSQSVPVTCSTNSFGSETLHIIVTGAMPTGLARRIVVNGYTGNDYNTGLTYTTAGTKPTYTAPAVTVQYYIASLPVQAGTIQADTPPYSAIEWRFINSSSSLFRGIIGWGLGATTVTIKPPPAPTCSITTPNLNFPLGSINKSTFTGIGSVSPWVTEKLVSGGCNATTVSMTFQGTANVNNKNLFAVTGGATGIGVDLQSYDGYQAIPNSATAITWGPRGNGASYDFKARYMQSDAAVTTGPANAIATVLVNYK